MLGASGCKELQKLGSWEAIGAEELGAKEVKIWVPGKLHVYQEPDAAEAATLLEPGAKQAALAGGAC